MKTAHKFLYKKKHTQTNALISCDRHQLYAFKWLGVDLEVVGVRYIEMHLRPAAHVLCPPPSRGVAKGRSQCFHGEVHGTLT